MLDSHCDHPQAVGRLDAFENRGVDPWNDLAEPAVFDGAPVVKVSI